MLSRATWTWSLMLAALITSGACTDTPNPLVPPDQSLPTVDVRIQGTVHDSAFRPIADASVELTDRAQTWAVATTDESGFFEFAGTYTFTVSLRATKPGYLPTTNSVDVRNSITCCAGQAWSSIMLATEQR